MNQTQRQFLLNSIEAQYKKEQGELRERKPKAPSLNNYLTAAILDGSFKLKSEKEIRSAIHGRVLGLGQKESLPACSFERRNSRDDDETSEQLKIPANVIFNFPPGYEKVLAIHEAALAELEAHLSALCSSFEAMKIKVQLGSDKALEALVNQADELRSMSLTASSKLPIADKK